MVDLCENKSIPFQFLGLGRAVPSNALSSSMLDAVLDLPDGTIEEESGVKQRYIAVDGETPTLLVQKAMRFALIEAGLGIKDIDLVILSEYPGTNRKRASVTEVGQALELRQGVPVMELGTSGGNSTSLLMTAVALIQTYANIRHVALIAVDQLTEGLEQEQMRAASCFGDGAAVAIVGSNPAEPGRLRRLSLQTNLDAQGLHFIRAEGELGSHIGKCDGLPPVVEPEPASTTRAHLATTLNPKFLEHIAAAVSAAQLPDLLVVPHQGSRVSLNWLRDNFKPNVPFEMVDIFESYGNQGVASGLFALATAKDEGALARNAHVLLLSMSAGLTYGACLIDLNGRDA